MSRWIEKPERYDRALAGEYAAFFCADLVAAPGPLPAPLPRPENLLPKAVVNRPSANAGVAKPDRNGKLVQAGRLGLRIATWLARDTYTAFFPNFDDGLCLSFPPRTLNAGLANVEVYFVNGVLNSTEDASATARDIADRLGAAVHLVYSETRGLWLDLLSTMLIRSKMSCPAAVQQTARCIKKALGRGRKVIVIGHSRGGTVVQAAVESLRLTAAEGDRVAIVTLGGYTVPAQYWRVPDTTLALAYVNVDNDGLLSTQDPVPVAAIPIFRHWPDHGILPSYRLDRLHICASYYSAIDDFLKMYRRNVRGKKTRYLFR
jgi:hypothetical protein